MPCLVAPGYYHLAPATASLRAISGPMPAVEAFGFIFADDVPRRMVLVRQLDLGVGECTFALGQTSSLLNKA